MLDYIKKKYNIKEIEPLEGGYSFCEKFKADDYVLKVFPSSNYESVKERVEFISKLNELGLKVPNVYAYGVYEENCYQLLSYIEGMTGHELANLPEVTQYNIGYEAGKELKIIHSLKTKKEIDMYDFHKKKIMKVYKEFKDLGLSFKDEKKCINFVTNNIHLLRGRDTYILHGDFHAENMAFDETGYLGAFDFERNKFTDYVRDFERVMFFTRSFSLEFTKGFLTGYGFKEYRILKLYLVMSIFNSFVWSKNYYPEQYKYFDDLATMIINDFEHLNSDIPTYMKD